MTMEVKAVSKYLRMSPRKVKLLVDLVRGKRVEEALSLLRFSTKAAAVPVSKAIRSAAANAQENYGLDSSDLVVKDVMADEAPTLKRGRFGARGRYKPVLKRGAHITVVLGSIEDSR